MSALHPPSSPCRRRRIAVSSSPSCRRFIPLTAACVYRGRRFDDSTLPFPDLKPSLPSALPFQSPVKPLQSALAKSSSASIVGAPISLEDQLRAASASPSIQDPRPPPAQPPVPKDAAPVERPRTPPPRAQSPQAPSPRVVDAEAVEEEEEQDAVEIQQRIDAQLSDDSAAQDAPVDAEAPDKEVPSADAQEEEEVSQDAPIDGPTADPKEVVPPTADDVAGALDVSVPATPADKPEKPPQVVHLPPQGEQEAKLKETERKLEVAAEKERKEDERLAPPNAAAHTDLVSSPSSTVGPYSQATPHAPHHSPDTSPDTASFHDHEPVSAQSGLGPDSETQKAKDGHDPALEEQLHDAHGDERADSPETPDVQRQIEHEQAIRLNRDGKSQLNEAQPPAGTQALTAHAEEVAQEAESEDSERLVADQALQAAAAESLPTPTTTAPESSSMNIETADKPTVDLQNPVPIAPEHPTPPADIDVEMDDAPLQVKEQQQPEAQPEPSSPQRMTTRVSSGALERKSVSDIIAEKAAPKAVLTPRSSNFSTTVSPVRPRSRGNRGKQISTVIFAKQDLNRTSKALQSYNEEYASLQGASQDSTRDYLEGLFHYQAHHPPRSVPLQELVASARKTLSTAGTLAMIREQQDYKILKRVYQLQNANR